MRLTCEGGIGSDTSFQPVRAIGVPPVLYYQVASSRCMLPATQSTSCRCHVIYAAIPASLRDARMLGTRSPVVGTTGYSPMSLRDLSCGATDASVTLPISVAWSRCRLHIASIREKTVETRPNHCHSIPIQMQTWGQMGAWTEKA